MELNRLQQAFENINQFSRYRNLGDSAASASPVNFIEMQIPRLQLGPTDSETLGTEAISLCQQALLRTLMCAGFENH